MGAPLTPFCCLSLTFYNSLSVEAAGLLFFCPKAGGAPKPCKEGLWAKPQTDAVCGFGQRFNLPKAVQGRLVGEAPSQRSCRLWALFSVRKISAAEIKSFPAPPGKHPQLYSSAGDGRRFRPVRTESARRVTSGCPAPAALSGKAKAAVLILRFSSFSRSPQPEPALAAGSGEDYKSKGLSQG